MKKTFILSLALLVAEAFTACSENNELEVLQPNDRPVVVSAGIGNDAESRTLLGDDSGTEAPVYWSDDTSDKFSVTIGEDSYTFTKVEVTTNAATAKFTCENAPVLTAGTYTAKYPATEVTSYVQQEGTKDGLHNYHYMEADFTVTEGQTWEDVNLIFETKVSILKLTLKNDDFKGKSVTDVTLNAAGNAVVVTTSTFTGATEDGSVVVYLAVQPQALSNITIIALCEGSSYTATLTDNTLASGKMYRVTKDMTKVETVTDLSPLVEGETARYKTANCYIVTGSGNYKFRATHMGNSHADEHALTIDHVAVLWETFGTNVRPTVGDLVSNLACADGYISFTASDKKGNALIAAYNSNNEIVWSWHIWMTDQPAEQTYKDNDSDASNNPVMMDRNIGATSATPSDGVKTLGLLYQWGRKDPFLTGATMNDLAGKAFSTLSTWPNAVTSDATYGTIAYSVKNPTTYINWNSGGNYDWYYTGNNTTDDTRWSTTKTIYDPSPYGWRVPNKEVWVNIGLPSTCTFENGGMNLPVVADEANSTTWYPAAGYCTNNSFMMGVNTNGYYWSVSPNDVYAYTLFFYKDGSLSSADQTAFRKARRMAMSIRCMKE